MALRKILNKSDEILHKVCKPVTEFDDKLGQLLDDMTETLKNANGVGLARYFTSFAHFILAY